MFPIQPVERLVQVHALVTLYNFVRPKGFYFQGESHDFWECEFVREGEVTVTADERVYQLNAGKLLVHKPMEFHRSWSANDCAPWIVNISFKASGPLMEKLAGGCFDLTPQQQARYLEISETFSQLMQARKTDDTELQQLLVNMIAIPLEYFLIDLVNTAPHSAPSQSPKDERYSRIVQVMKSNCHRNLTTPELAAQCHMSVSNIKRVFRQYSDIGIAKYFMTLRIRYAMELLENGTPANQVAEILNFADTPYFYTVFKRETGITPTQYRKEKQQAK